MVSFNLIDAAAITAVAVGTVIYVAFMLRVNIRQAPPSSPATALPSQQLPPPPPPNAFNEKPSRMQNVIERVKEIIHPTPTDMKIRQLTTVARQHAERFGKMNEQIRELKSAIALKPDPPMPGPPHISTHHNGRRNRSEEKEDADWKKEQVKKPEQPKKNSKTVKPEIETEPERNRKEEKEDVDWIQEQKDK